MAVYDIVSNLANRISIVLSILDPCAIAIVTEIIAFWIDQRHDEPILVTSWIFNQLFNQIQAMRYTEYYQINIDSKKYAANINLILLPQPISC